MYYSGTQETVENLGLNHLNVLHSCQLYQLNVKIIDVQQTKLIIDCKNARLTENNKRRVEATEINAPRRSTRISRKERIRNVTIRQQIGLEETIIKELKRTSLRGTAMFRECQKEDYPK